jgi:hypothetical protein
MCWSTVRLKTVATHPSLLAPQLKGVPPSAADFAAEAIELVPLDTFAQ